jgi:hypothetical protein
VCHSNKNYWLCFRILNHHHPYVKGLWSPYSGNLVFPLDSARSGLVSASAKGLTQFNRDSNRHHLSSLYITNPNLTLNMPQKPWSSRDFTHRVRSISGGWDCVVHHPHLFLSSSSWQHTYLGHLKSGTKMSQMGGSKCIIFWDIFKIYTWLILIIPHIPPYNIRMFDDFWWFFEMPWIPSDLACFEASRASTLRHTNLACSSDSPRSKLSKPGRKTWR